MEVDLEVDLEGDLEGNFRGDFKQDLEGDLLTSSGQLRSRSGLGGVGHRAQAPVSGQLLTCPKCLKLMAEALDQLI